MSFAKLSLGTGLWIAVMACAYQTTIYGIWAGICAILKRRFGLSWIITGPLCMACLEATLPFMFKMYLGIIAWRMWPMMQIAEIGGPPAVSGLIILVNLVLGEFILARIHHQSQHVATKIGAVVFILLLSAGWIRGMHIESVSKQSPQLNVGLLQPNFGIVSINERKLRGFQYIKALQKAMVKMAKKDVDLIIWPESSWPYPFNRTMKKEFYLKHPYALRPNEKNRLLFGSLTYTNESDVVYNSAILIAKNGNVAGYYHKNRLVPFGENIPLADIFPNTVERIRKRLPEWPDIVRGESPQLLIDGNLRIAPLICSEDIEMDYVHHMARLKPNLLVSIANDAWFEDSAATRQHLALAAFRAVETRRDLVRDTNTGISAIVDALGRVKLEGPLVHVPINDPQSPTLLTGEVSLLNIFALAPYTVRYFPWACFLAMVIIILSRIKWVEVISPLYDFQKRKRKKRQKRKK